MQLLSSMSLGPSGFSPRRYRPSLWLDASRGVYQDAACQFTAADKSWLKIVDPNSNIPLNPGTNDFLWSLWVWRDSASDGRVLGKGSGGNGSSTQIMTAHAGGTISFSMCDNVAPLATLTSAGTLATGQWYHIVAFADRSGLLKIYINGVADANTLDISGMAGNMAQNSSFNLGSWSDGNMPFNGRVDSLMLFRAADLSAVASDIIAWAYNSGAGRLCSEITDAQKTAWGAVSGWELGEATGRRYDSWGSNHLDQAFGNIISPTVNNGGFETLGAGGADVFGSWTEALQGTSTINDETAAPHAGSHACRFDVDAAGSLPYLYQSILTSGKLYSVSCYAKAASGTPAIYVGMVFSSVTTDYALYNGLFRASVSLLQVSPWTGCNSNSVFIDSVTLRAAEILAAPGIARGVASDSNFAVQLNGTDQYLSYTGTAFDPGTGDFSVGCSFYLDKMPASVGGLFSMGTVADDSAFVWVNVVANGQLQLRFNDASGALIEVASSASVIVPGRWYTLVATYDRDGNLSATLDAGTPLSGSIAAKPASVAPGHLFLGRYAAENNYHFPGRIDNAFYCNRLLSAAEIAFMHNNGQWRQWAEIAADQPSLAAAMKGFWEGDDAAALGTDSTPNGNHLTPQGSPTQGMGINYLEGTVSRWEDQSGGGKHATITTLAQRPAYVSNVVNGKPVMRFDGVDDWLLTALTNTDAYTVIAVVKASQSADATRRAWAFGAYSGLILDATQWGFYGNEANLLVDLGGTSTNWSIASIVRASNASVNAIIDGGTPTSINPKDQVAGEHALRIASQDNTPLNVFSGDIAEILVYPTALTDIQRAAVELYLSRKYGVALA